MEGAEEHDTQVLAAYQASLLSIRAHQSNLELLSHCEPDSQVYNHLKSTLDLVKELSRVALENVRATTTEVSTQATGHGRGGRGSGGHGRSGGPGGGHEDKDDLGNFQL
nr:hypothetical protein CFP56_64971 [Quercus suber]